VLKPRAKSVSLSAFLNVRGERVCLANYEDARQFYVDYHMLLWRAGIYTQRGLLLSSFRSLLTEYSPEKFGATDQLVFVDGVGASGQRTVSELGLGPIVDLRPRMLMSQFSPLVRAKTVANLVATVNRPAKFFRLLFDTFAAAALEALNRHPACRQVVAANERSLGCAPALAAAKFQGGCGAIVVQHGNPIADYLPTIADEYWCRSERWYQYLRAASLGATARRIQDFPTLHGFEYDREVRRAVLVLHNVGYLEPTLDYSPLVQRVIAAAKRSGWDLYALPHPANPESFGLPLVDRRSCFKGQVAIGFRSTATDQMPRAFKSVSLLDYWPDFSMQQGSPEQLESFLARVEEAFG
jgi:hypothetical protein